MIIFLLTFFLLQNASAQVIDSSFYNWTVYELQQDELDFKTCYIVARPIKTESDHNSRQQPYIMITRYQKDRSEEVSVFGGYEYKLNSKIFLMIDNKQFSLRTKDDTAWSETRQGDVAIINTLINSISAKVRSDSSVGTFGIDEYSLKGITRAYARMREICE